MADGERVTRPRTRQRRAPRQDRAQDTLVVLLEATERVLAKRGFFAATTNEIAAVAGVGIGTLYRYFPTKEALVERIVHRMWEAELEVVSAHAPLVGKTPLRELIRTVIHALCMHVAARADLYRAWYGEAGHLGELGRGRSMLAHATELLEAGLRAEGAPVVRHEDAALAAAYITKLAMTMIRSAASEWPDALKSGALGALVADTVDRFLFA
jgi:AcrR family transcriptional regulator